MWWYLQSRVRLSRSVRAAEDPIQDVVSVAPLGWVCAAGEAAAGVSGDRAMVWPGEASRRVLPSANGTPFRSMMVGQMSASSAIRRS